MLKLIPTKRILLVLIVIFVIYSSYYGYKSYKQVHKAITQHATIIAKEVWNLETETTQEYLSAVAQHYGYAHISIEESDNTPFLVLNFEEHKAISRYLIALKLIPLINLQTDISYSGGVIGTLNIVWKFKAIYHYLNLILILALFQTVAFLYNKIVKSNISLDKRIKERTADLNSAVIVLKKSEDNLRNALQEKEVLLKEVHHRVKNNMIILYSLIKLQQNLVKKNKDAFQALEDTKQRIHSIAKVHTMLYQAHNLSEIDFSEYIKSIASEMNMTYNTAERNINVEFDLEPLMLNIDTAIPCGLIINELFTNSLKHAFPDSKSGIIKIVLKTLGIQKIITHSDNGIGMDEALLSKDIESLGLKLTLMLVNQIRGEIKYERRGGSHFTVFFE